MPTRRQLLATGATTVAATTLATGTASADTNPNIALIQQYYAACAAGDLNASRRFFARDIRWTIPGHHPLAGTKQGVDEVPAFRIRGREIVEAINFAGDRHVADAYFLRTFPLAPLPRRFA